MSGLPSLFEPAPRSDAAPPVDDYIPPTLGHALRVWWAYYWPTMVISLLLGILLDQIVRLLYENLIVSAIVLRPVMKFGGYVINYVVAFFVLRYLLGKTFRHFKLGLISADGASPARQLEPTFARTLRVWWTFTWRGVVYGLLAFALVILPMGIFFGILTPNPVLLNLFYLALGTVIGGFIALFVIYSNILGEDFGDFRVVLLPRENPAQAGDPLAAMPAGIGQITR